MVKKSSLIFHEVRANPKLSYRELTNTFIENCEKCLSSITVKNILLKPMLTARHWLIRLRWCKDRIRWSLEKWKQVIFSCESNFEVMNRKSKVLVKRFKSEKYSNCFIVPRYLGLL